jgi:hypothetical protein
VQVLSLVTPSPEHIRLHSTLHVPFLHHQLPLVSFWPAL